MAHNFKEKLPEEGDGETFAGRVGSAWIVVRVAKREDEMVESKTLFGDTAALRGTDFFRQCENTTHEGALTFPLNIVCGSHNC